MYLQFTDSKSKNDFQKVYIQFLKNFKFWSPGPLMIFDFFRCVLCSHLAIFKLRSYWQERLCMYTGASCSNRPGTHRRILLLFFLSDLSPRALLKKGLRDLSLTSILAMCVYTSIACRKVGRPTLPCLQIRDSVLTRPTTCYIK